MPPFLAHLASKLLAGDTEKLGLLGTSPHELLRLQGNASSLLAGPQTCQPQPSLPTAIKAEWYWYTFTDPSSPDWWHREPIANNPPTVWTKRDAFKGGVRQIVPQVATHVRARVGTAGGCAPCAECKEA